LYFVEGKVMEYIKKHKTQKALDSHVARIEARGGTVKVNGLTVKYSFLSESVFCPICEKPEKNKGSHNIKVCKKCQKELDK
jgi:hypothetical protein